MGKEEMKVEEYLRNQVKVRMKKKIGKSIFHEDTEGHRKSDRNFKM